MFKTIDTFLLRKIILFYDSISSVHNHFSSPSWVDKIIQIDERNCRRELYPVICKQNGFCLNDTKDFVITFLEKIFELTEEEMYFLHTFEEGKYQPEYLFEQKEYVKRIENHPMAKWYEKKKTK